MTLPPDPDLAPVHTRSEHDISVIDTGHYHPGYDAAYLLQAGDRAVFIDTGVNAAVPRLLGALAERGLTPESVDWVILTHVHLDHAGGAGSLMAALPRARLGVHPRGVRHMADPGPLMQAVRAVYGDAIAERDYGTLTPVPVGRIEALMDGAEIVFGGRRLAIIESPGHAKHHICIWDAVSRSWFTGDAFGLCLQEFATPAGHAVVPSTSPAQFDQVAFHATVARLLERVPRAVFPTHFGQVLNPERLAPQLLAQVDAQVEAVLRLGAGEAPAGALTDAFVAIYLQSLRAQGWQGDHARVREVLGIDLALNVDGMRIWGERQ